MSDEGYHVPMSRWCDRANERIKELEWMLKAAWEQHPVDGPDGLRMTYLSFGDWLADLSRRYEGRKT